VCRPGCTTFWRGGAVVNGEGWPIKLFGEVDEFEILLIFRDGVLEFCDDVGGCRCDEDVEVEGG
jgi:hypothetical protein